MIKNVDITEALSEGVRPVDNHGENLGDVDEGQAKLLDMIDLKIKA